jgi:integrase
MAGTRPLNDEELADLHAALRNTPARDAALVRLMLNLGFRISEMLALNVGDIWHDGAIRPRVRLNRARLKGGTGPWRRSVGSRTVIMNDAAKAALEEFVFSRFGSAGPTDADAHAPLIRSRKGGRLSLWAANRAIARIMAAAGISGQNPGELSSHALRKTFCTSVYRASGKDVMVVRAAMNHRHLTTTQAYLSIDDAAVERAIMALGTLTATVRSSRQEAGFREVAIGAGF